MAHSIKTVYVVHHSHTDIGYTDLQERVIAIQVNYIKTVLSMMRQPEYADFRWNCETLYCVEEFWKQASEDDRADFARFVKEGKIGISANYLNFNDLVNADVFGKRLAKWQDKLQPFGTKIHTAMAADVNGFSILCLFFIRISPFVAKEKARCTVQWAWSAFGSVFLRDRRGSGLVGFAVFFVSIIELLRRDTGIQTPLHDNRIVAAADGEQLVAVRCVHGVNHDFMRRAICIRNRHGFLVIECRVALVTVKL